MGIKVLSLMIPGLLSAASGHAADPAPGSAALPTTKPVQHLIVEGQVFDHVGAGVSGAEVRVFVPVGANREEIASATTDEMGDFKVHHTEPVHGKLIVTFAKPGFKPHEIEVESVPDEFPPFIDHRLQGALKLGGLVRDALTDAPIAGAKVVVKAAYNEWSAGTDEGGEFEVEGLPPCRGKVTVEAEGFARLARGLELEIAQEAEHAAPAANVMVQGNPVTTPDGAIVFLLKPERIVRLTITEAEGKPIPKVVVESLEETTNDFRTGATDADGKLVIRRLSIDASQLKLRLTHPEYVSSTSFDRVLDLPPERTASAHTLTMAAAATISGKVTSADGKGLGSARLTVGRSCDELFATAWSDFDGTFTLSGVPAGKAVVTVHLADYAPRLLVIEAHPEKPTPLDIVLSPAVRLGGRVLDPDGQPLPGAHVRVVEWRGYRTLGLQAMTDADGRFTILDAPADELALRVSARGFKPLENQLVRGGETDLVFQFTEAQAKVESPLAARLKPGEAAPAFEATTLDGRKIKLADFRGKYVLLSFWATWCGPCVVEAPHFVALHKALGRRKDFELIGVSLDSDEQALRKFLKDNQFVWTQVFGDRAGASRMANQFGAAAIPTTYLIGPDGRIVAAELGGESLVEQVRKLIDQAGPSGSNSR